MNDIIDDTPGVDELNRRPFACSTALVLWRPPTPAVEGEVVPKDGPSDLEGDRWFWELVQQGESRASVAAGLGPILVRYLDRLRAAAGTPTTLDVLERDGAHPTHKDVLKTVVSFRFPEIRRITNEVVVRGITEGARSLLKEERNVMSRTKNDVRPFPILVKPFGDTVKRTVGFTLHQEYAKPLTVEVQ